MLLLFALSASAQPALYGGNGPYYGAGTPGPYGAGGYGGYGAGGYGARPVAQSTQNQNQFALSQVDRTIQADQLDADGHNLFYNIPLSTAFGGNIDPTLGSNTGFLRYGAYAKAASAQQDENRLQIEIDHYRRTHPQLTQTDRDHLNDLALQRESARNQKLRRTLQTFTAPTILSTGGPVPAFFERRANEDDMELAQNSLVDARNAVRTTPSSDNLVQLRNAQDDVEQADARRDANTYDLLGNSFGGASKFAPVLRKKASQDKLEVGYRNLRLAQQNYAKTPTEINRLNVKLANLFIDATSQEDDGNKNDIIAATVLGTSSQTKIYNAILGAKNFQDESDGWLRYDRLKRKILIQQQMADAKGKASANTDQGSVADRMLGMSMYGAPAGGNPRNGQ